MPVKVEVDRSRRLAKRTYIGVVTASELLDSIHEYRSAPEFDPSFNELMDFREVDRIDASIDDIRLCALRAVPFANTSKRVILAPQPLVFGLARMYQIIGEDIHPNVYVVKTEEDAFRTLERTEVA
ncbi:hypothetical protein Acid345_1906 [Candidatus Koribacter versatilis Ellin345]|uniref:Uncharacterized protein n=1 Tax=Koribacter versatilis (strain Ellin345) TaxID=204669 RepID=Q1IQE3_KORVE|nr:hypothetical protein [Candidatus Koribacter versatilis]ABF40907.1 hypothetical protein Acid345_1906 [Candidatus Koribacter versatilis Ellin345]